MPGPRDPLYTPIDDEIPPVDDTIGLGSGAGNHPGSPVDAIKLPEDHGTLQRNSYRNGG